MKSYQKAVSSRCCPDPILDTVITTGEKTQFTIVVKAHLANYSNKEGGHYIYWYIKCTDPWDPLFHPFRYIDDDYGVKPTEIWDVIADNPLVRMILQYLTMSDAELSKFTGNTHVVDYRAHLIQFIQYLWD